MKKILFGGIKFLVAVPQVATEKNVVWPYWQSDNQFLYPPVSMAATKLLDNDLVHPELQWNVAFLTKKESPSKCCLSEIILIQAQVDGWGVSNITVLQLFTNTNLFSLPCSDACSEPEPESVSPLIRYCFLHHVVARFFFLASSVGGSGRTSGWTHASDGEARFF